MQQPQVGWVATGNFEKESVMKYLQQINWNQTLRKNGKYSKTENIGKYEDLFILTVCWFIKTTNVKPTFL